MGMLRELLLTPYMHAGLLFLRVALGLQFMFSHGLPKLSLGPAGWSKIGSVMGNLGITAFPAFWGFLAALSEFGGGLCLVLGLLTRFSAGAMAFTMLMAVVLHITRGDSYHEISHALELMIVFTSIKIMGGGKYTLDHQLLKWPAE